MRSIRYWKILSLTIRPYSISIAICLALLFELAQGVVSLPGYAMAAGESVSIHITGIAHPPGFTPDIATVHSGTTLVFLNDAQPSETYTITADDQNFVSPPITPGQQWSTTFSNPGTYEYHALNTAQLLVGTIIVVPASVLLLPTPRPGVVATQIALLQVKQTEVGGATPPSEGMSPTTLFILVAVVMVVLGLSVGGTLILRRRKHA